MEVFIIIIVILIAILGILGAFLPAIPGPPLSIISVLIYKFSNASDLPSNSSIWILLAFAIIITVFDFVAPMIITKKFGGSALASKLSFVGMIIGIFFFPPFGFIIGPFLGAFIGELIYNRKAKNALKIAFLAFISFIITTGLKFSYSVIVLFILLKCIFFN